MRFVFLLPVMLPHTITLPPPNRSLSMRQLSAKYLPLLLKARIRPSRWQRLNLDSSENRTRAHCCRLQRKCRCGHCKRAARWRAVSTCPTKGLLGRMGCRAYLRRCNTVCLLIPYCLAKLVAVWKRRRRCVSVMNLSVRGFVTLDLAGLRRSATRPVCWKRCTTELLCFCDNRTLYWRWRRCRASIINAWIRWFWFSLGMFIDKRCEIKCVFPYVVGIRIMSIHISCDMYLRLGLHMQIRLYYVLPYKAKILAQHGIGFILDRCTVYLGLIIANLKKKRLLIFETFNNKKCTLFFGTEYI